MRALVLTLALVLAAPAQADTLRIGVAANFRATLEAISEPFQRQTGHRLRISSASTGVLANQARHGAPFDLLFAADRERPEQLLAAGTGRFIRCYAVGSLVLAGGDLDALGDPQLSLAIANPDTAPYGRAALEVLARPQFAAASERTLVRGTNVLQALQFWRAGAADLALIARSVAPGATAVPGHWHQALAQYLLVLNESPAVSAYLQWLGSDTVRDMIDNAGYQSCP